MAHAVPKALLAGALGILLPLAGCTMNKSGQAKEVTRTVTSMQATRQELAKAQVQIDDALAALDQLGSASPADLPRAYKTFTRQVSRTVSQADTARSHANEMRGRWRDYMTSWERESERFSTPELRAKATERRQAVQKNYDSLRDAARMLDKTYPPFLTQLKDIQTSLSLDLTPAGVQAAQPAFQRAHQSGADLKQVIANFMSQIDQVMAVSPPRK
jgi:chromosome segregation ATPase